MSAPGCQERTLQDEERPATRLGRPIKITDAQILNAAREAFQESGSAATALQIAKRAGVSEGILFKRFATKAALLRAAFCADLSSITLPFRRLLEPVAERTLEANLSIAAHEFVGMQRRFAALRHATTPRHAEVPAEAESIRAECVALVEAVVGNPQAGRLVVLRAGERHAWAIAYISVLWDSHGDEAEVDQVVSVLCRALAR